MEPGFFSLYILPHWWTNIVHITCELQWLISPTKMVFDYRGGPRITRKNTRIHNLVRKEASRGVVQGRGTVILG